MLRDAAATAAAAAAAAAAATINLAQPAFDPGADFSQQMLSTVHLDELAEAYLRVLEHGDAGNAYNAVNEPWPTQLEVQQAIADAVGAPSPSPMPDDLLAVMGPASGIFTRNSRVSAARLRSLGWTPHRPDAPTTVRDEARSDGPG